MKKYIELIKNVGILTLSNFGSKLLSFFLVPLYTSVLSTKDYGNFDLISVSISLLIPLLTVNIAEGAGRYLLDNKTKNSDKSLICGISLKFSICSIIVVLFISLINYYFNFVDVFNNYFVYFILLYISTVLYQHAQNIVRGCDKLNILAISGIINSCLMLGLNLLFLLILKIGLDGFFLSHIISNFVSTIYLMLFVKIKHKIIKNSKSKKIQKDLVVYSKPLMVSSIGWWINNVSDRYLVTFFCGVVSNGIYSVSYKIPSILSIVQTIFNQAWTVAAAKNSNVKNDNLFFKNVYSLYNLIMIFSCSVLIIFAKILSKILYMNEFYIAWKYTPFLIISLVFGGLSGMLGGIFSATKNTKILGTTTIIGAIINTIGNILLINVIGIQGAAISTAISYFIVWLVRSFNLKQSFNIVYYSKKDFIVYGLLVLQGVIILYISNNILMYFLEFVILIIEFLIYKFEIIYFFKKICYFIYNRGDK